MTGLGKMGIATWINKVYPLGRIAHCIAATIATLASHPHCAAVLMANNEQHGVVATLMLLCAVHVCPPLHTCHAPLHCARMPCLHTCLSLITGSVATPSFKLRGVACCVE